MLLGLHFVNVAHLNEPLSNFGTFHCEHQSGNAIGNTLATSGFKPRPAKAENSRSPLSQADFVCTEHWKLATEYYLRTPHHECRWNYKAVTLEVVGSNPTGSIL